MGNCLAKSRVKPEARASTEKRDTNGGWRRNFMKRLRLGKHTARVDVSPVEETDDAGSSDYRDDTDRKVSKINKDDYIRQKQDSKEIEKTGSVLILFYAREEKEEDSTSGTPRSLLAIPRASPYFSSEESLYEGFEDTSTDIEQEIEEEINSEEDVPSLSIDNKVEEENTQTQDQSSANDKTSANFIEPKPICAPTTKQLPKCHFYASGKVNDVADEEIPEEVSLEEDDRETNINNVGLFNSVGTGNVSIDNDTVEQAIHKTQLIKSGLKVPKTLIKAKQSKQAQGAINNATRKDKFNYSKDSANISSSEITNESGVSELRLTYDKEKQASDAIDNTPRNDKFTKKRESPNIVSTGEKHESEISGPILKYDKENQDSNSKDNAPRNDKNREYPNIVSTKEMNESEALDLRSKYDKEKQASNIIGNVQRNDKLTQKRENPDIVTTKEMNDSDVLDSRLKYNEEVQAPSIGNAQKNDKFTQKRESPDIVTTEEKSESEVSGPRLTCHYEKQASSAKDNVPRNDKFSKKGESPDIVTTEEANKSNVPGPRLSCDKEKEASSIKDKAPRNDKFTKKKELPNNVSTKVSTIKEVPASRLTYEQDKQTLNTIDKGPGKDTLNNKKEFSSIVSTEKSNKSAQSTCTEKTCGVENETQSMPALWAVSSSAGEQCAANEELKSKIAQTVVKTLDKIKKHKAKSDCCFDVYVRSAKPDWEPRRIQIRATSNQVKDGAARTFVKSLGKVADPVSHFDPFNQQNKKIKGHVTKNSNLVLAEDTTVAKWVQKQGTMSNVSLTKVPQFYETPPKKKNAREKLGLKNLQKYNIKVQCKEIERIKIDEEQFPGILPPKLFEQWKKKREEKKLTN